MFTLKSVSKGTTTGRFKTVKDAVEAAQYANEMKADGTDDWIPEKGWFGGGEESYAKYGNKVIAALDRAHQALSEYFGYAHTQKDSVQLDLINGWTRKIDSIVNEIRGSQ